MSKDKMTINSPTYNLSVGFVTRMITNLFPFLVKNSARSTLSKSDDSSLSSILLDDPEAALNVQELHAVGRITVQMAALELDVMHFLSALLFNSPKAGISVFLGVNLKTLIEMLLPTFRLKVSSEIYNDDIESLVSALDKLADERNSIVHGQWHFDPIQQSTLRARNRKAKRSNKERFSYLQTEKTSALALNQFADIVLLARKVLVRFYEKLIREGLIAR